MLNKAQLGSCEFVLNAVEQHPEAYILNSTFGQCSTSGRFKVVLSGCNIDSSTLESTLLNLNDSELHIMSSTFQRIWVKKGPAVIKGEASEIEIENTVFKNNHGYGELIQVLKGSRLFVFKSIF